jgi:hypothetical protein
MFWHVVQQSHSSAVSIVTSYKLDNSGVRVQVPGRSEIFSTFRRFWGPTQPPIQWVPRALSLGVKQLEREADHSPSASAAVKKTWIYTRTSTPPYALTHIHNIYACLHIPPFVPAHHSAYPAIYWSPCTQVCICVTYIYLLLWNLRFSWWWLKSIFF